MQANINLFFIILIKNLNFRINHCISFWAIFLSLNKF